MKKWTGILLPLATVFVLTSFGTLGFLAEKAEVPETFKMMGESPFIVSNVASDIDKPKNLIVLGKGFLGFKESLAFKESQGKYDTINKLGYLGKYQFGKSTLKMVGVHSTDNFLQNPELQEEAFKLNVARNKWILRRYIKLFSGKKINGIEVTESGMVAASHLAGAGNVKKYLNSYGREDFSDAFGSSVAHYMKIFGGYDISSVPQKQNPKKSN